MKINAYDLFFRSAMKHPTVPRQMMAYLIRDSLTKFLDSSSLKIDNTSYVNKKLKELFADSVYFCDWKAKTPFQVSLLFEHKSYLPDNPYLQLMDYQQNIWNYISAKKKGEKRRKISALKELRHVIPIIFYHGEKPWNEAAFTTFFKTQTPELSDYIPNFKYELIDLSQYSIDFIKKMEVGYLANLMLALKFKNDEEAIRTNLALIFLHGDKHIETEEGTNFLQSLLVYITSVTKITYEEIKPILQQQSKKLGDLVMSTYETVLLKGKEIGKEIGKDEKASQVIISLVQKFPNMSNKEISEIAKVSVGFVEKVRYGL